MFRASLCPSSGEQECALPHMVFCTVKICCILLVSVSPPYVHDARSQEPKSNVFDFYFLVWSLSRLLCCVVSGSNVALVSPIHGASRFVHVVPSLPLHVTSQLRSQYPYFKPRVLHSVGSSSSLVVSLRGRVGRNQSPVM